MRFLQLISSPGINGAVIYGVRFSKLLAARGHEVLVAALPGSWAAQELDGVLEWVPTTFRRTTEDLNRLATICRTRDIQVTHSHLTRAHTFGLLLERWTGIPHVAHAHSHHRQWHWFFQRRTLALLASEVTAQRRWYFRRPGEVGLLFNYVDTGIFRPAAPDPKIVTEKLGVPADAPVVACVAEIIPRKGQLYLIRAWSEVLAAFPLARLVLLGREGAKPAYAAKVRAEARRLGVTDKIVWAGFRDDIPAVLPYCAVAVLPSLAELFSLGALEAMACGVPVVATNVGGFPEMITPGENGELVPPRDPAALAGALIRVLRDESYRRRLAMAARARIERDYTADAHYARYMSIMHDWEIDREQFISSRTG